ncbi:MAG TPA: AI-2E family transporter YdiK [Desulfuromonadales bacterium]|jgi:predicted PurR-regulated permease PerM
MLIDRSTAIDITRTTLAVLFIGILIAACFWIMRPFLLPLLWAAMIVIATWPLMRGVQKRLWGRRGLAVTVMTLAMLLVFFVPFTLALVAIVQNADEIVAWARSLGAASLGPPPDWLGRIPVIGSRIVEQWQSVAAGGQEGLAPRLAPYASKLVSWLIAQAGSVGMMLVSFLLTVILSAILYANGETAANGVCRFARRLAGPQGEEAAILAGKAVRGVALGVVVTALVQAFLAGIGLAVAGIPAAMLLTAVIFVCCVAQIGPAPVLFLSVGWLFWKEQTLWGSLLLVWSIGVGALDNFLRPILIKRGADLPLLLIFAGVIGGLIAFGVIGLFIGPVMLAVTYTLLGAWVDGEKAGPASQQPGGESPGKAIRSGSE